MIKYCFATAMMFISVLYIVACSRPLAVVCIDYHVSPLAACTRCTALTADAMLDHVYNMLTVIICYVGLCCHVL